MNEIGREITLEEPFDVAIDRVSAALAEQGFGILTRIDVRATLKEKLGVDFRDYVILGACNPSLAHQALSATPEVGLLLPCNVTVEEGEGGRVSVRIIDPLAMLSTGDLGDDPAVADVASKAASLLDLVARSLTPASAA